MKSDAYAYRDRRNRKRDFRGLWIVRINAAARREGLTYSRMMAGLRDRRGRRQPQDACGRRRARPRDVPPICRASQAGPGGVRGRILIQSGQGKPPGRRPAGQPPFFVQGPDMTEPITSRSNPRLKELRKLHERKHRERTGLFVAEGEDMLTAALNHGRMPETLYFDAAARARRCRTTWSRWRSTTSALASAGTLGSGSRVIGVWRQRWAELGRARRFTCTTSPTRATWGRSCGPRRRSGPDRSR